jgi:hypothetical protein
MSIILDKVEPKTGRYVKDSAKVMSSTSKKDAVSFYNPTDEEKQCRIEILNDFRLGWQTMHLPRPELNDYSLYQRHIVDMLSFNSYQENDGNPMMEDRLGGWRSKAMRPLQRNKAISIAAHMTARQLVPKIFAYNDEDEEQEDSAKVMSYLVDWAREQAEYPYKALYRTIAALYSPISWGYTEYVQTYRKVKDVKVNGKWTYKQVLDESDSGHQHMPVATDQVFFPNFYERDPQRQDFIIYRSVISYNRFQAEYPVAQFPNAVHVKPGVVIVMDDANSGFYQVYDPHMRQHEVEKVIRWRKSTDSKDVLVNGVLMTEAYAENKRIDHQYPWDCFYYLPINERCIAGKSLVFALGPESNLLNTQYQMINDANFLNLFPPTVTSGSDKAGVDVMVPGLNLAFADKDVQISTLRTANDQTIQTAMNVMQNVEKSLSESSQDPIQAGQQNQGPASTAYEISRIEQNAATVLGLTMKFMANMHVIPYGRLLLSDILQYETIMDASKIDNDKGSLYKTFYVPEPGAAGKKNKISFDSTMPDMMTPDEKKAASWELLLARGSIKSDMTLWRVNPVLFREQKYIYTMDSDVLNPRSAELTRAFDLETYDRAINSPVANQEELYTDLLMGSNPKTARDPDKYVTKPPAAPAGAQAVQPGALGDAAPGVPTNAPPQRGSAPKPNMPIVPNSRAPQPVAVK